MLGAVRTRYQGLCATRFAPCVPVGLTSSTVYLVTPTTEPSSVWCGCLRPLSPRAALGDVLSEARELVSSRSRDDFLDEASDVCFGVGRLLGALVRRTYVPVPFAKRHKAKIAERMASHGCVRSARHLEDGRCPSQEQ